MNGPDNETTRRTLMMPMHWMTTDRDGDDDDV